MSRIATLPAICLLLSACLPGMSPTGGGAETPVRTASDPCGAEGLQYLVGQGFSSLATMTFASDKTRFIEPNMAVTQDHRRDRLNIVFDRNEKISRVYCG